MSGLYSIQGTTLTSIADAIRAKTGKTDPISPLNMPTEIAGIETGAVDSYTVIVSPTGTNTQELFVLDAVATIQEGEENALVIGG